MVICSCPWQSQLPRRLDGHTRRQHLLHHSARIQFLSTHDILQSQTHISALKVWLLPRPKIIGTSLFTRLVFCVRLVWHFVPARVRWTDTNYSWLITHLQQQFIGAGGAIDTSRPGPLRLSCFWAFRLRFWSLDLEPRFWSPDLKSQFWDPDIDVQCIAVVCRCDCSVRSDAWSCYFSCFTTEHCEYVTLSLRCVLLTNISLVAVVEAHYVVDVVGEHLFSDYCSSVLWCECCWWTCF